MNIARKRWSAILLAYFALLISLTVGGCNTAAPKPGTEIVHFDNPSSAELKEAPADGKYGCYLAGKPEPLESATLKKGDKIGFEILSPDEGRGQTEPKLIGVAGQQRFFLRLGDAYAWKRM